MSRITNRWNRSAARLVLTGLVVALAGGAVVTASAAPPEGMRHGGPMMGGPMTGGPMMGGGPAGEHMGGPMMGGRMSERALDAAGATAEQKAQIRTIMQAAHNDLQAQREQRRALHDQMRAVFTQTTVDANAAEAVRVRMQALHEQASKRRMQAMVEASRVLSPEQRTKLADWMAQRRSWMEHRRGASS